MLPEFVARGGFYEKCPLVPKWGPREQLDSITALSKCGWAALEGLFAHFAPTCQNFIPYTIGEKCCYMVSKR